MEKLDTQKLQWNGLIVESILGKKFDCIQTSNSEIKPFLFTFKEVVEVYATKDELKDSFHTFYIRSNDFVVSYPDISYSRSDSSSTSLSRPSKRSRSMSQF